MCFLKLRFCLTIRGLENFSWQTYTRSVNVNSRPPDKYERNGRCVNSLWFACADLSACLCVVVFCLTLSLVSCSDMHRGNIHFSESFSSVSAPNELSHPSYSCSFTTSPDKTISQQTRPSPTQCPNSHWSLALSTPHHTIRVSKVSLIRGTIFVRQPRDH